MTNGLTAVDNMNVKQSLLTTIAMQQEYRFYAPPVFDGLDALQNRYIREIRKAAGTERESSIPQSEKAGAGRSGAALVQFISALSE
jgi:multiple sugar transport system substrate-binding protein